MYGEVTDQLGVCWPINLWIWNRETNCWCQIVTYLFLRWSRKPQQLQQRRSYFWGNRATLVNIEDISSLEMLSPEDFEMQTKVGWVQTSSAVFLEHTISWWTSEDLCCLSVVIFIQFYLNVQHYTSQQLPNSFRKLVIMHSLSVRVRLCGYKLKPILVNSSRQHCWMSFKEVRRWMCQWRVALTKMKGWRRWRKRLLTQQPTSLILSRRWIKSHYLLFAMYLPLLCHRGE